MQPRGSLFAMLGGPLVVFTLPLAAAKLHIFCSTLAASGVKSQILASIAAPQAWFTQGWGHKGSKASTFPLVCSVSFLTPYSKNINEVLLQKTYSHGPPDTSGMLPRGTSGVPHNPQQGHLRTSPDTSCFQPHPCTLFTPPHSKQKVTHQ